MQELRGLQVRVEGKSSGRGVGVEGSREKPAQSFIWIGLRISDFGLRFWVPGFGLQFRVSGFWVRRGRGVQGLGFRVQGSWFRV